MNIHSTSHAPLLVALLIGVLVHVSGAQEGVPFTHIVTSPDSPRFFVMDQEDRGGCYEAKTAGQLQLLWKTEGWYGYPEDLFLTHNGSMLVHIPKALFAKEELPESVVIAFYFEGKLVRVYRVKDLIKSPESLKTFWLDHRRFWDILEGTPRRGVVGRYELGRWIAEEGMRKLPERPPDLIAEQFFFVETIEKHQFVFNIDDGSIIYQGKKPEEPDGEVRLPWDEPADSSVGRATPDKPNKSRLDNPLPRPESKSDGSDKPQPEAEGRSR
jgi:hypothetical protein